MALSVGFAAVAEKLQEAACALAHSEVRSRLSKAVDDVGTKTGKWANYIDHTGDGSAGHVIYSHGGDMKKAPYSTESSSGKTLTNISHDKAVNVHPSVTYKVLPDDESKESAVSRETDLKLVESAACLDPIVLKEARADYEIKLIAPGKGSSAFYPAEVLKRDGPKVFKEGTHVYLNHATASEEAERPEGDVRNLAGVLTQPARWHESHAKGPGLYGRMKVFADHAQTVEEKAPHVGMSIRASGVREAGKTQDGLPVLKELTSAESVDVVTRPGAGGMILTEAARAADPIEEVDVDNAAIQKLQESNRKLAQRLARSEAREAGAAQLAAVRLPDEAKEAILTECVEAAPITTEGDFDATAFKSLVESKVKFAGKLLGGGVNVTDMGTSEPAQLTEAQKETAAKEDKKRLKESAGLFGLRGKSARRIFAEGREAFDPNYNAGDKPTGGMTLEEVA